MTTGDRRREKSFAFVCLGPFSGINAELRPRLEDAFSELSPTALDIAAWVRSQRRVVAANLASVLAEYGPRPFLKRDRLLGSFYRSPYIFSRIREEMRLRATAQELVFSIQTQSMFDASVPQVPHFVYTDHTALANTYYPDFDPADLPDRRWLARERQIYQHASMIFTMSGHVSRSLAEHYGVESSRIRCVYAGSNVRLDVGWSKGGHGSQQILFVGRGWERKGGPQLVAAFEIVRSAHPDATLLVAGCRPQIDADGITVIGDVPPQELDELYRRSAVFCMPTRVEPFGLVFVEALSHAVPVVASSIGAVPDIVQDGETGFLTEPGDVRGVAEAISALLSDPEQARSFGWLGQRRMQQRYTWPRVVEKIAGQIRETLSSTEACPATSPPTSQLGTSSKVDQKASQKTSSS